MSLEAATTLLTSPSESSIETFLDSESVVWIDWRHEDDEIVNDIEAVLETGKLSADWIDADNEAGCELQITYGGANSIAPLEVGPQDRHITIVALNAAINADYEVRFCIDSDGGDTLAVMPMTNSDWQQLESQFGDAVAKHFYRIAEKPNLFTETTSFT